MANKGPNPKIGITMREKYGEDYYKRIGAKGGKKGKTGGFFADRELAREAGRKGGLKSKRGVADVKNQIKEDTISA